MTTCIVILDFGSQYTQLIARRIRELKVYCEIFPYNELPNLDSLDVKGIILSGSPYSVNHPEAPQVDLEPLFAKYPVLGICYGAQYLAKSHGGSVGSIHTREFGRAFLTNVSGDNILFKDVTSPTQVWMSHGDTINTLPETFERIASTEEIDIAAFQIKNRSIYGIQFHPEVTHSTLGGVMLKNFVVDICKCKQDWTPSAFIDESIDMLKERIGSKKVVMGLSGGVDSTVAAVLIDKAIGDQLYCIFVDSGLLRKNEFEEVLLSYKDMGLNIKGVDAKDRFYNALEGISNPEAKRKAIGKTFIEVFDEEAHKIKDIEWLGQGTIYSDVIESASSKIGPSVTIKSHHNVGGLPETMRLKVIEPLNTLFKDEVRKIGEALGVNDIILNRHPFPGPGLAIRILGDVTPEKVAILQEVDHIFINALKKEKLYNEVWQAGVILLPIQSVGVMGDERTYEHVVALRSVVSLDGMTADWSHLPYEFLGRVSNQIINRVKGVNRVVYDISSKPPATIEWE